MPEKESATTLPEGETVEGAVRAYVKESDVLSAIAYLRAHKKEVSEFCLQIEESYPESDSKTPVLMIARILQELL